MMPPLLSPLISFDFHAMISRDERVDAAAFDAFLAFSSSLLPRRDDIISSLTLRFR